MVVVFVTSVVVSLLAYSTVIMVVACTLIVLTVINVMTSVQRYMT